MRVLLVASDGCGMRPTSMGVRRFLVGDGGEPSVGGRTGVCAGVAGMGCSGTEVGYV